MLIYFFIPFALGFGIKIFSEVGKKELLGTLPDRVCKRVDKIEHFATATVAIDRLIQKD